MSCGQSSHNTPPPLPDSTKAKKVTVDSTRAGLVTPKMMSIMRKNAYDSFYVRIEDSMYFSNYKGRIYSADSSGKGRHFILDIKSEYMMDEIYFHPLGNSRYFVAWQETAHIGVSCYFAVYKRGADEPEWKHTEKAPSPGPPVVHDDAVYVSTLGMIGKLHLSTGETYWMYDSLYDQLKLSYKEFEKPLIYQSTVCFYDFPIKGKKAKRDSIWVNDNSGKIIR
jgi:outer membrane protein assembly factor BamB